jgi:hypothetical protein
MRLWTPPPSRRNDLDRALKAGLVHSSIRPVLWRCYAPGHDGIRVRALARQRESTRCHLMMRLARRSSRPIDKPTAAGRWRLNAAAKGANTPQSLSCAFSSSSDVCVGALWR